MEKKFCRDAYSCETFCVKINLNLDKGSFNERHVFVYLSSTIANYIFMRHFFLLELLVLYRKAIFNLKIFKNKYLRYQEIVQFSLEVFVTDFFAIIFFFFSWLLSKLYFGGRLETFFQFYVDKNFSWNFQILIF